MIGNQIGKGSNAAVYEAAATFAPPAESKTSQVQLKENEEEEQAVRSVMCCSLRNFPLAIKMMWNFGVCVLQQFTHGRNCRNRNHVDTMENQNRKNSWNALNIKTNK